jgi:hypothetical protein
VSDRISPSSVLNVEFAHVDWTQPSSIEEIGKSLAVAKLACGERGWHFDNSVRSILVDDKEFTEGSRAGTIGEIVDALEKAGVNADFICFESDLRLLLPRFVADLAIGGGTRQARSIERYLKNHGRIACSHDIAIWHAFRLGRLGRRDELLYRPSNQSLSPALESERFYSDCVVSSIRAKDMGYEADGLELLRIAYGSEIAQNVGTIGYGADD